MSDICGIPECSIGTTHIHATGSTAMAAHISQLEQTLKTRDEEIQRLTIELAVQKKVVKVLNDGWNKEEADYVGQIKRLDDDLEKQKQEIERLQKMLSITPPLPSESPS